MGSVMEKEVDERGREGKTEEVIEGGGIGE